MTWLLDLRWTLFGLLVALLGVAALAVLAGRWLRAARDGGLPGRAALDRAPFGWLVLTKTDRYRYANPYARRLLGLPAERGRIPVADWSAQMFDDVDTARGDPSGGGRYRVMRVSEDRFASWWAFPQANDDVVYLLDVTAQQHSAEASRTLLSGLAHELRTPIGTLQAHIEAQHIPDLPAETRAQSLAYLRVEVQRMARMVQLMLELGRLDITAELERRPVELLAVAQEALAQVKAAADERGIGLDMEADAPLPLVFGDRDRLKQVFLNLLDNAVKYCRPADRVTVTLRREADGLRCAVCDTGPGIPAQHLPHLTRRFYRAAPQALEGSGLGLALVQEVLVRHRSRLEIVSRTEGDDTGTCMSFLLPADA